MKINPLHNIEWLADQMKATGEYPDPTRCTGRTTSIALQTIAKAMQYPHQWVGFADHPGGNLRFLAQVIRDTVAALKLKHFTVEDHRIYFGRPQ